MTSVSSTEREMKALGFVLQTDGTWKKESAPVINKRAPAADSTYPQVAKQPVSHHSQILTFPNSQIVFPLCPVPAPRMTKRDQWRTPDHPDPDKRQRACVTRYFAFKNAVKDYSGKYNYTLTPELTITFTVPMPVSWSQKKRNKFTGKPHQVRPDIDNYTKAVMDSFGKDDGFVWHIDAKKIWGEEGSITIYK